MSKVLANPIIVELRCQKDEDVWTAQVYAEYGVKVTEYPEFSTRKSVPIVLTPEQSKQILTFAKNVVAPQLVI